MMKMKHRWKTRLCSVMLTVCMLFSLLPMSVITFAVGTTPVSVMWEPQEQTTGGERQVKLTAQLTQNEEAPAAALIDIYLNQQEAEALQWDKNSTIDVDKLGTQGDQTQEDQTQEDQTSVDQTQVNQNPADVIIAEDTASMTQSLTFSSGGNQAVLITGVNGGAVLRILLANSQPFQTDLVFGPQFGDSTEISLQINAIRYKTFAEVTEIDGESLLADSDGSISLSDSDTSFIVYKTIPEEITVSTATQTVNLDGEGSKDITYTISLQKAAVVDGGKEYTFTVDFPKGLSLPVGVLSYNNGSVQCGGTEIAKLEYPGDAAGSFSIREESLSETDNGFSFTVIAPYDETAAEDDVYDITLILHADQLVRSAEAFSGDMTLTVSAAGAESKTASAAVSAGGATLPGEGGWKVKVTQTENKNQSVFWRDNEQASARPEGWNQWDSSDFWPVNTELYYTLTDQNGVTYERTLLTNTEDSLGKVGLTAYPEFSAYGAYGFTVKALPKTIQQVDPSDESSVLNTYTVTWYLEAPESVEGYDFRDIRSDQVGAGSDYPSINTAGWYYMQRDTFFFILDIRQGNEDSLDENREDKLRALLNNFQFNWSYTGGSGSNGIIDMIQAFHATPSYDDGKVTITGMWKYNVDGSPINYSVTKIPGGSGDTTNGKITTDELGGVTGLLEENEWYQIQYVNTGVPGEGQDTIALHSGGTLQLVRQGNTQYQATKIWLDSYGSDSDNRPTASFSLYRYRKGQDPGTAALLTGYTVQLIQKTDEEGQSIEGYAVQVMTGDEPADLPKYDTLDGAEFVYVVRETLSGANAGQYEQVFGTVTVDETTGKIIKTEEPLPKDALPSGSTERPSGNTYLYNSGTLTNYQTGTIPVSASKTWSAAAYQSQFDDVAVELTLQYRVKDSGGDWQKYTTSSGETVKRYLHRFYAESLSDTLTDRPSMPKYATAQGTANQELEYRWLETAVYTDAPAATERDLGGAEERTDITYPDDGENSAAGDAPAGSFTMNGSNYTVSYAGGADNTQITNAVSEYLNYNVTKEWRGKIDTKEIKLQILRSVAGGDFAQYLEFTMNTEGDAATVTVSQVLPAYGTAPDGASDKFQIKGEEATTTGGGDQKVVSWNALVSGLPRFDERGRPYEYLLLEANALPSYRTELDPSGNYSTTVINGGGEDGFNLLVRKVWLDDGDMEHRDPVTLTLYNKNNNQPITLNGKDYTITLGGTGEENLWHKVVWIGTTGLGNTVTESGDDEFDEDDVYLVETEVGGCRVDHHLEELEGDVIYPPYAYLYGERNDGEPIFEVTTDNHRYQVTYVQENTAGSSGPAVSGVGAAFTITNRRLGSVDLTVTKDWVDGRDGDTSQVLGQIQNVLQEYARDDTYLALAFRLVFDDSMGKTEEEDKVDTWNITYSGPSVHSDTVCVGGEGVQIYSTYEKDNPKDGYGDPGSSEWIILGYVKDANEEWTTIQTFDTAYFLGLPKYDTNGEVVAYSVEEVWLNVTEAGETKAPTVVDFTKESDREQYSELYALWQDFDADYEWGDYIPDADDYAHTRDEQPLKVTNARRGTKTVQWTVEWRDDFTLNSDLRPDIYLDVYQVTYDYDDAGNATPVIKKVTGTVQWDMTIAGEWTASLSGVSAFDSKGNEIFYYAVQRTVMAAGDYDYQAALYQMNGEDLGSRDEPNKNAGILAGTGTDGSATTSITDANGQPYDLAVLGQRSGDELDTVGSIRWGDGGQPAGIGPFGTSSNYPKYALLEGGTIINTLAENYTIEGVKYWTNLPNGWETKYLPQVTFTVSRYTEGNQEKRETVAKTVISSELWEELKNGTQYQYLIAYEGNNVLGKGDDGKVCVKEVCDLDTNQVIENPTLLPRYEAETGALWTYEVEETINWDEGSKPDDGDQIFKTTPGGFTFTNSYEPTDGSIRVKKFLYLPKGEDGNPEAYPAVTFKLTRQVSYGEDEDGSPVYVADKSFGTQTVTLSSKTVQEAWNYLTDTEKAEGYVTLYALFEKLDLYAPNGREYKYTVIEDRDELKGYDTWAMYGDVESPDDVKGSGTVWTAADTAAYPNSGITDGIKISGLTPTEVTQDSTVVPAATFKNQQETPPQTYEDGFTATKKWDDNDNAYGFRPTAPQFKELLEYVKWKDDEKTEATWTALKRTAAEQTGQGNVMTEYLIPKVDFTVEVTEKDGDYKITINPMGTAFDLYAPNGRPWVYSFSEPTVDNRLQLNLTDPTAQKNSVYAPTANTGGTWPTTIQPTAGSTQNIDFGDLTNTTHMSYQFTKEWVDENGDKITENYLGKDFDLTVAFQLQVSDGDKTNWADAGTYFAKKGIGTDAIRVNGAVQGTEDDWDTATITGTVDASVWSAGGTFTQLPTVLKSTDGSGTETYTFLQYRVVETEVTYGGITQTVSDLKLDDSSTGGDGTTTGRYTIGSQDKLVTGATFTQYDTKGVSTSTNQLATTSVSVEKVWDDTRNQYGTRPGAEGPWSWASWFVLQRSTDGTTWDNVALFQKLFGSNAESGSEEGVLQQEKWTDEIIGLPTMNYQTGEFYIYQVRELQPKAGGYKALDQVTGNLVEETDLYGEYGYKADYEAPDNSEHGTGEWTVTNTLRDDTPGELPRNIRVTKEWAGNEIVGSVTFQLKYTTANTQTPQLVPSNLVPERTVTATNLTVTWTDLPDTINNEPVTGYLVEEKAGSGWVQIAQPRVEYDQDTGTTTWFYTFTNSAVISYSVEKDWNPDGALTAPVTLGLYRTTSAQAVGSTTGTAVPVNELDSTQGVRKVTLSENTWTHTFTNLPKYDTSGQPYYYYVLELNGSTPIGQNGKITLSNSNDYEVTYDWTMEEDKTTVTNTTTTSLTGTKTWMDNGNVYGTRPTGLTLILERRVGSGKWDDVSASYTPDWDIKTYADQNQWTYTYTGLPSCDNDGNPYTYQVREVVPAGYTQQSGANGSFTNVLSDTVTITGQKIWSGGVGTTPTLTLERKTANTDWTDITGTVGQPTWTDNTSDSTQWTFTYTNLDKYDKNGVLYEYRVREKPVPDGYEADYKTGTVAADITGHPATSVDGLTITNYKDGSLTVSKTVSGNRGDQTKNFTFTVTLIGDSSAGTAADSITKVFTITGDTDGAAQLQFTNGKSAEFTLKHNESITIQGLPAGIGYRVTEAEADQDGYNTYATGDIGSIPAGGTAEAEFDNYNHDSGGGGDNDRMNLTGRKIWVDKGENDPKRPDSITLELYRKTADGTEERVSAQPTWVKNGNTWTYTFHNLPKADKDGNKYTYWVSEVAPDGYTSSQSGNDITNRSTEVEPGSLLVSKQVTGSGGDPTREFTFTVTLSNKDLTGTYGQMIFVNGVATFTLRDGESLRADNLPAGTTYTVVEKEANQDGYTTTATGDAGTIQANATVSAVFTNYRPGAGTPETPDTPDVPDTPDLPDDPDVPDTPQEPDDPSDPEGAEVPTGDRGGLMLYGVLTVLFTVGLSVTLYLGRKTGRKRGGKRLMQ